MLVGIHVKPDDAEAEIGALAQVYEAILASNPDERDIIILGDQIINKAFGCDHGIAAQSILLGATELGFGGCMIGSIQREGLRRELEIPKHLEILLVIALGKPIETVEIEVVGSDGDVKYWRDENDIHHVPKRSLDEIIIT